MSLSSPEQKQIYTKAEMNEDGVEDSPTKKKKKRKHTISKSDNDEPTFSTPKKVKAEETNGLPNGNSTEKKSKKKKKHKQEALETVTEIDYSEMNDEESLDSDWTKPECSILAQQLIEEIEATNLTNKKHSVQLIGQFDWMRIARHVPGRTSIQCQEKTLELLHQVRKYRTNKEVFTDLMSFVNIDFAQLTTQQKRVLFPNQPKKPLTPWLRFCEMERPKYMKKHPKRSVVEFTQAMADKFKELDSATKKHLHEQYEQEMAEYHLHTASYAEHHPGFLRKDKDFTSLGKVNSSRRIYIMEKIAEKKNTDPSVPVKELSDKFNAKWKKLSDRKKLKYINKAEEEFKCYQKKITEYKEKNPDTDVKEVKSYLTKEDIKVVERCWGIPEKPLSGYQLFVVEQNNMTEASGPELMTIVAQKWKALSPEERARYNEMSVEQKGDYKIKLKDTLNSLSPEQRTFVSEHILKAKPTSPKKTASSSPSKHRLPGEPDPPQESPYQVFIQQTMVDLINEDKKYSRMVYPNKLKTANDRWLALDDGDKAILDKFIEQVVQNYKDDVLNFMQIMDDDDKEDFRAVLVERNKKIHNSLLREEQEEEEGEDDNDLSDVY